MALPSSGPMSLSMIQAEFGGANPISLSEYYKNGPYVLATDYAPNVPTSGTISLSDFYGAARTTLNTITYSAPGTYSFAIPTTLQGSITILLVVGAGGGGGGSTFSGDGHGAANGGSGGYYQNAVITGSAGGQTITIVVGQGGAGVPAATTATGGTGSLSFVSIASIGYYLGAGAGTGGAGVFGDNNPAFGGSGGAPNGVAGSNTANWMINRNTAGTGYAGQGQNGTGYGDGGLGGNPNGPVPAGSAGGDGFVQFQGYW